MKHPQPVQFNNNKNWGGKGISIIRGKPEIICIHPIIILIRVWIWWSIDERSRNRTSSWMNEEDQDELLNRVSTSSSSPYGSMYTSDNTNKSRYGSPITTSTSRKNSFSTKRKSKSRRTSSASSMSYMEVSNNEGKSILKHPQPVQFNNNKNWGGKGISIIRGKPEIICIHPIIILIRVWIWWSIHRL